jgi:hypothetical protein
MKLWRLTSISIFVATLGMGAACERKATTPARDDRTAVEWKDTNAPEATTTTPLPEPTQPVAGRDDDMGSDFRLLVVKEEDSIGVPVVDESIIEDVEQGLASAGFQPGLLDGKSDESLVSALRSFQSAKGIAPTGHIDRNTAAALELDWERLDGINPSVPPAVKDFGHDVKSGAQRMGTEVKEGTQRVGEDIDQSVRDLTTDDDGK